ncbi:MAG: TIGR03790 family protein [Opitutaceae bacterium]|nr:TIGR03790 family protein [Opitutaceae bacterium]
MISPRVRLARWLLMLGLLATPGVAAAEASLTERVLILANSDDPDSLRIARHYAEVRRVPNGNIIALKLPVAETITWREFVTALWQPLLHQLVSAKWIDAIPMDLTDVVGRRKYAPHAHRIAALVVCRGVPLKISHDPALYAESLPFTSRGEFRTNAGAVDAELSLLAIPNYPINAFVPNPLFQNHRPTPVELAQVVKVSRLDAPTAEQAMALVDHAVAAERTGLLGRAYVDLSDRDPVGNGWLQDVAKQLRALDYDLSVDAEPGTFPAPARMDAPVLYFGWYAGDLNGPFALPGFRFPAGAIALHIHSYSAATLRSTTSGWTGPLIARGATATVGNVHEPYLQFTHQPHLFLRALARGDTLVDAAYYALQALSWQAVLIGDPLYRPFGVPLEQQLRHRSNLPPLLAGYAVLRRMNELDAAGRSAEAITFGLGAQRDAPSLPLTVALGRRFQNAGEMNAAADVLGFVPRLKSFATDEWGLAREACQLLEGTGRPAGAVATWRTIFANEKLPRELRIAWLPDARRAALAARDFAQAAIWERELDALTALPVGR